MLTAIDHLVVAVPDLDQAAATLRSDVGLAVIPGGTHPDHGTANALVWLGDTYLELVAVVDPERARGSWFGRLVAGRLEAGGGLAAICLASDDLDADLAAARARGAAVDGPFAGARRRPDGRLVRWRLAVPADLGPDSAPFLIEHDPTAAEWTPPERAERAALVHPVGGRVRLGRVELPVADLGAVVGRYLRTWGILVRPSLAGGGAREASVGEQAIRFRRRLPGEAFELLVELVLLPSEGASAERARSASLSADAPAVQAPGGDASSTARPSTGETIGTPIGLRFRWRSPGPRP